MVALPDHKAWAELVAVPATSVFALPAGMSYLDAAAITMNYTVAYILLFELANLTPGKNLLLHSAGGGVVSIILRCCDQEKIIREAKNIHRRKCKREENQGKEGGKITLGGKYKIIEFSASKIKL